MKNPDPIELYDEKYFGHVDVGSKHISNYSRVGGYHGKYSASDQFADWVQENFEPSKKCRILEIGCAQGHLVAELRKRGYTAFGIDYSEYILTTVVPQAKPHVAWGDIYTLIDNPFVRNHLPYSIVVTKDVLEHVDYAHIDLVIKQMTSIAENQMHVINTGQHVYQAWHGDSTHKIREPLSWWQDKFRKSGCRNYYLRET